MPNGRLLLSARCSREEKTDLRTSYEDHPFLWVHRPSTVLHLRKDKWNKEID